MLSDVVSCTVVWRVAIPTASRCAKPGKNYQPKPKRRGEAERDE